MLLLVILLVAVVAAEEKPNFLFNRHGLPPPPETHERAAVPMWSTIAQPLDNFDPNNTKYWDMRYISNPQFWLHGGPIFIFVGGEGRIEPEWLQGGQMYDMAEQNNAWMFLTEHRYYGASFPTPDLSTENLKYLTTPQALQDVANFIMFLKRTEPGLQTSKVVIFGGSYSGNMAIWLREKYPLLVHAAVSSSAPVMAKVDFFEFLEVVQTSLADSACVNVIRNGIAATQKYLASGDDGIKKVQLDYNMCSPVDVNNFYDRAFFFNQIASTFGNTVQYADGNAIPKLCNELKTNPQGADDYTKLARLVKKQDKDCRSNFQNLVKYLSQVNISKDTDIYFERQWTFQTCNEYGYFITSNSTKQPFGYEFPVQLFYEMCAAVFGSQYNSTWINRAVENTNANYGAKRPVVTRVVSVHGEVDPWHPLGLSEDVNPRAPVIVVPGASHCADLNSILLTDNQELKKAQRRVQKLVKQWLAEH